MTPARRALAAEIVAVGCVVAYNVTVPRVGRRARLPANLGAAAALVGLARASGVETSEMGLDRATARRGTLVGLAGAVPIALTVGAAVANPRTRGLLADEKITGTTRREAAFETLLRIPLETALSEEVIFRSVLLALGQRSRSTAWAIGTSSLLFGLWHVAPTLETLARNPDQPVGGHATASTAAVVAATAGAGACFAGLRLIAGSVVAPVIAHATLNMVAFAGVRVTTRSRTGAAR